MSDPAAAARPARRAPPALHAAAAVLVTALLGGCSTIERAAGKPPPPPPVVRLDVQAPKPLAELLQQHLDLSRVNKLAAGEPLQEGELDRLVAAAPQQARDLLDTEGYFNADVTVEKTGGTPPGVRVTVQPGPRTQVAAVAVEARGPLATDAAAGQPHARDSLAALRTDWPLPVGEPFRADDWSRAKTATLAALRGRGYVRAEWAATSARVDAATQRADLAATAASGPLFRVGPLQVTGLVRQNERTVHRIADLEPGVPATEALLLDIQERLQRSDLFDRATVTLAPDPADPASTPVIVQLGERKLQEATFGVGFGANVGPRLTVDHIHRRPFGKPWLARNKFELSEVQQTWNGELSTQTLPGLYRNLVGGAVQRVVSDTDVVSTRSVRVGRAQDTRRIDRQLFVEYQRSTTSSALGRQRDDATALQYQGVWRKLDDNVLPTRGRAWTGQFGAGFARSDPGEQGPFGRIYARLDAYRPLGKTWYGQGRLEVGEVLARDGVRVPEALRFRAGGDESVRGYAYRSLTAQVNGVDVGGKVLATASLEAARPFLDDVPQLWAAVFVDAGRAALSWDEFRPAWGAGVGLRYRSPVGPVKLDLAWGHEVRNLRLHLSVGLAF